MQTRDPKAERMGILGIQLFGYEKSLDEIQESQTWVSVLFLVRGYRVCCCVLGNVTKAVRVNFKLVHYGGALA